MKLISLYIDNFGTMSNFSYSFEEKLNNIYQENGWGKTTLTAFIKAMLYGLTRGERERYTPWKNISMFGGSLIVEADNISYRIEKSFNPKKQSLDTVKIYNLNTGLLINDFDNFGSTILNLTESSFERSVFIPEKDLESGFGSDIEAKLLSLIGGTNDTVLYDEACNILNNRLKEIKLNNKKGQLIDKKNELYEVENQITDYINKQKGINLIEEGIRNRVDEINQLNIRKKEINEQILIHSKNQEKNAKLEISKRLYQEILKTKDKIKINDNIFNGISLTEDDINDKRLKNKELQSLATEYTYRSNDTKVNDRLTNLENQLSLVNKPTDEEIEDIQKRLDKINNIKAIININKPKEKKKILHKAIGIAASTILMISLVLIGYYFIKHEFVFLITGMATSIIATLGYLLMLIIIINNGSIKNFESVKAYDYELRENEAFVREFFFKHRLYTNDYANNLYIVKSSITRYNELLEEYNEIKEYNNLLVSRIRELKKDIELFLCNFNTTAKTTEEKIGELSTKLRRSNELKEILKNQTEEYNKYMKEFDLSNVNIIDYDIDSLNNELNEIDKKIDELNELKANSSNKIIEFENEISNFEDIIERKNILIEEINILDKEYKYLELTYQFLENAQKSLLEKYVKPMKESVSKYVSKLLKVSDYNIDINFNFQFITTDGLKSIDLYSKGVQALISLCMRLALIDCLYPKEKPFIILDDPFANFDDDKLFLVKKLIKEISNTYQIVYFCCHESRIIN